MVTAVFTVKFALMANAFRVHTICFLLLFLALPGTVFAQDIIVITGKVVDAESRKPLENVDVYLPDSERGARTDQMGKYSIWAERKPGTVEFYIVSHNKELRSISASQLKSDTLVLDVLLTRKNVMLEEAVISASQKADTVFGTHRFSIMDYEFFRDKYIFLINEKSRWKVMLAGDDQEMISQASLPVEAGEPKELYKDFLGFVNVICREHVFRVKVNNGNVLSLASLPFEDFNSMIRPCIDTIGLKIYFSNYRPDYPRFMYYAYNIKDSSAQLVREIVDEPLALMQDYEYDFLKPRDKLTARKLAQELGADKRDVAAAMTGFGHSKYFTPLYAPLFVRRDTILIFDHYSNALLKYDRNANLVDSLGISYHKPKNWKEWERQLVEDETNGDIYALYLKGAYYYLKKIDLATGKLTGSHKLTNKWVEHVHVRNGYVYYIYRPFESIQKKFLYKERINLSAKL